MSNHTANDSRIAHEIANMVVAIYVRHGILDTIQDDDALATSVSFDADEVAQEQVGSMVKRSIVAEASHLALATLTAIKEV